ncbi:similar to Saccharomyces cerevisiae YDL122W UBP1 Ubiquitin-specific protease that removes ubiquitin from ubiquitinated proteins [Maudiozyma saulgeensis]|uniref:Ubiquitin carboxyl-terminal hydrolase n=1 Tax=Maudiozyma saulgeensis TaxID=1789683 RepID=A0A1X7R0J4_9SACH|nr:similar to Saccharomyces cerevisiae YDL122W UBP1 Ubiquitin-specific protease that removes ubiquitin from ubiquitinated proteins [Kazachstania saulgeensis]
MNLYQLFQLLLTLFIIKLSLPFARRMYSNVKRNTRNLLMPRNNNRYVQNEAFLKRGGYLAGLLNEGNTCFMNSVLQSLASSQELMKFLQETIDKDEDDSNEVKFSIALLDLLNKLDGKYGTQRAWFETTKLLKTMSNGPNKNIILGYDQEDAQEFFQQILLELEKDVKLVNQEEADEKKANNGNHKKHVCQKDLPTDALLNQDDLQKVGTVYIPTDQIEPNLVNSKEENYYTPFRLVTPLDGTTVERVGCLTCGENGGIRYSVFSGLSLNLPSENIGATLKLTELLNEWSKPEIIEGVDCNRCALNAVREHLQNQIESNSAMPTKLADAIKGRIAKLDDVLSKPVIDDEDYKELHTENMVRKCSKSKQIIMSRPPPLLSIHINRSVFDPRTYMIRKNNSRVLFKSRINLGPWCCTPNEINLDARLPLSKKEPVSDESSEDENIGGEYYANLHHRFEQEFEDSDEDSDEEGYNVQNARRKDVTDYDPLGGEMDDSDYSTEQHGQEEDGVEYIEEVDSLGNTIRRKIIKTEENDVDEKEDMDVEHVENNMDCDSDENHVALEDRRDSDSDDSEPETNFDEDTKEQIVPKLSTVPATPLTYSLRAVIIHYGTHNYGHYIVFRKHRGLWWRISDETADVVEEEEVLSTPGVFMLFYEYDYDQATGKMKDDIAEYEEEDSFPEILPEKQTTEASGIDINERSENRSNEQEKEESLTEEEQLPESLETMQAEDKLN